MANQDNLPDEFVRALQSPPLDFDFSDEQIAPLNAAIEKAREAWMAFAEVAAKILANESTEKCH